MNCRLLLSFALLTNLFSTQKVFCQKAGDVNYYNDALSHAKNLFLTSTAFNAAWMNGKINLPYSFQFEKGSPFFAIGKFEPSVLRYEGIDYPDVPLLYDELANKLITLTSQGRVELINRRVDGFTMLEHQFIYLYSTEMPEAFYELRYKGKSQVLARNKKTIKEDLVSGLGVLRSIEEHMIYYVKKGNHYINIKSKKTLLAAFADHKTELQQLIKLKKLGWKKDAERLIVEVVSKYDQLTN